MSQKSEKKLRKLAQKGYSLLTLKDKDFITYREFLKETKRVLKEKNARNNT